MKIPSSPLRRPFGTTRHGEAVEQITLSCGALSCEILTYGGILRTLHVPDRNGTPVDVVLGFDTLSDYETQDKYMGALVGRCANRIARGQFTLNNQTYPLAVNNGPNHLHGGLVGFNQRVWRVEGLEPDQVVLSLTSPDGEEGYPGRLEVRVTYQLTDRALSIHYQASADGDTPCNLTNHSYFNLSGHGSGPVLEQDIQLHASRYTPADQTSIPTGELALVEGTPMDLRQPTPIGRHIDEPFQQLIWGNGYDHNWVIDGPAGSLRPAAQAHSPATGILLQVETTLPGIQFYTANYVESTPIGKGGAVYGPRHAFCLETQFFPDAIHHPSFPSPVLRAGGAYDETTVFTFSTKP